MSIQKITLKIFFFAGVTAFLAQLFCSCTSPGEEKFIGLQLYSVRDAMNKDVKTTVAEVGDMGYNYVEAAGYNDGKFYGMSPVEFKELCETNGLQLAVSGVSCRPAIARFNQLEPNNGMVGSMH